MCSEVTCNTTFHIGHHNNAIFHAHKKRKGLCIMEAVNLLRVELEYQFEIH